MSKRPMKNPEHKGSCKKKYKPYTTTCDKYLPPEENKICGEAGQHFHIDFGFFRGSAYKV